MFTYNHTASQHSSSPARSRTRAKCTSYDLSSGFCMAPGRVPSRETYHWACSVFPPWPIVARQHFLLRLRGLQERPLLKEALRHWLRVEDVRVERAALQVRRQLIGPLLQLQLLPHRRRHRRQLARGEWWDIELRQVLDHSLFHKVDVHHLVRCHPMRVGPLLLLRACCGRAFGCCGHGHGCARPHERAPGRYAAVTTNCGGGAGCRPSAG
mmetsp:Transcript_29366/g.69721  ORF Transcript_29366/g.69721 Transcript_29366/m.69721 type:complete len:211 (-) Transcript_29366:114-746(-)